MNQNTAKNLAIASLVFGCIAYAITLFASMQMAFGMFNDFNFEDPEGISNSFMRYFESLNRFRIPIIALCSAGLLCGLGGLRAEGKQKGMAIAGLILSAIYLFSHLIMLNIYERFLKDLNF